MVLSISYIKFKKYADLTGSFSITEKGNSVEIIFKPSNPDALDFFTDKSNVTIRIYGKIINEELVITRMILKEFDDEIEIDEEYMKNFLKPWLEAINDSI